MTTQKNQTQLLSEVGVLSKQEKKAIAQRKKEELKIELAGNATNALRRSANEKLKHYIKSAPQYKTLKQQVDVIKAEILEYKKRGASEHVEVLKVQLQELKGSIKKFENIVKSESKVEREQTIDKVHNSERLKELRDEAKALKDLYNKKNPNSILTRLNDLRKKIDFKNKYSDNVQELNLDETDDLLSTEDAYDELIHDISELTEIAPSQLYNLPTNKIIQLIRENQTDADKKELEDIKLKIEANKMNSASEIKRLKGYHDITDIMYGLFDFETDEEQPKDMLASANVKYVQAIAYNICSRQGAMRNYEDAVSYGLLGLTQAINKWYKLQRFKDSAITFDGFAHQYITNSIKRGLFELSSGGMISGSMRATLEHKRSKAIEYWMKHNSELKDIPEQYIEDIVDGMGYGKVNGPTTESDYNAIIGGEDSDADFWSRTVAGNSNEETLAETKILYEDLVKSLKSLFTMFDTKVDKTTGIKKITDKKLFDKYDYQLFLMYFGLKTKYDTKTGKERKYNQTEMAEELSKFYAANGIKKTFSQPAINARIKMIMSKISNVMKLYPEIKRGFEYLLYNVSANSENMSKLSASREELGIDYDLAAKKNAQDTYNEAVNNGKKIAENYGNNSQTLDDEIADIFTLGKANVRLTKK